MSRRAFLSKAVLAGVALHPILKMSSVHAATSPSTTENGTWINVKNFGAIGDGLKDDSYAIQSAIDFAHQNGGGTVFIPAGTYLLASKNPLTGACLYMKSKVWIRGAGMGATTLTVPSGFGNWDIFRTNGWTTDFGISDLTYDGNGRGNIPLIPQYSQGLLFLNGAIRFNAERIHCIQVAGQRCFSIGQTQNPNAAQDVQITGCLFEDVADAVSGNAIQNDHSSIFAVGTRITIAQNHFFQRSLAPVASKVATAIECHGSSNLVSGNTISYFNIGIIAAAIQMDHCNSVYSDNLIDHVRCGIRTYSHNGRRFDAVFSGGSILQSEETLPAIDLDQHQTPAQNIQVSGIHIRNTFANPVGNDGVGIAVGAIESLSIAGVHFSETAGRAISLGGRYGIIDGVTCISIRNCQFVDCGRTSRALSAGQDSHASAICFFGSRAIKSLIIEGNQFENRFLSCLRYAMRGNSPLITAVIKGNDSLNISVSYLWSKSLPCKSLIMEHIGEGNPEGKIQASPGSTWRNVNGTARSTLFIKESGISSLTGWRAI